MSLSPWVAFLAPSLALATGACARPPDLQVLTESTRLAQRERSPKESPVSDDKIVRLRGARGETLGLEVRIADGAERMVRMVMPESAAIVTPFSVGSLEVREPSSTMYGPSRGRGIYPDVLTPREGAVRT